MNLWPIIAPAALAAAGAGLASWGAMGPSAQLFGPTLRRTGSDKTLALTFDDGPNPAITPRLLDLLEQHHVRATFFLIGRFVRACPDLVREVAARGHRIGNHTDTHPNLIWLSRARIREELVRCQESIAEVLGSAPLWMRPPYGYRGPHLDAVVHQQGITNVVMWSVIVGDWKPQPAARLIARLRSVRGSDMVVLHDGDHRALGGDRQRTLTALEHWLPRWLDAGLEFVTVDAIAGGASQAQHPPRGNRRN
ncbi:MAG: polysaccharide deacetylase family protein [Acidobacteria bacterium]|nr:polysaccharide deacetylase family protein [Acidobacteriota bacterium]